jgi:hypothetical protein
MMLSGQEYVDEYASQHKPKAEEPVIDLTPDAAGKVEAPAAAESPKT